MNPRIRLKATMVKTRLQGQVMTERIFGPFRDSFDGAFSRLEAAVSKSEDEAHLLEIAVERLLNGAPELVGAGGNGYSAADNQTRG
jgi:hypothetical protein